MTTEELAKNLIEKACAKLRAQWAEDVLGEPDLSPAGDDTRRLAAIKARMAEEIAIQITMEINRQ